MEVSHSHCVQLLINRATEANGHGKSAAGIFSPGDMLRGNMYITSKRSFEISKASIYFDGISGNWIATSVKNGIILGIAKAERKFLNQSMDILPSTNTSSVECEDGFYLSIPFYFIISTRIPIASPDAPEHCLQIPPSIELGHIHTDAASGKRFAQPRISYTLGASVCFAGRDESQSKCVEAKIPIIILPYTKEFPPTHVLDFPTEFTLDDSKSLRWSTLGRKMGNMTVSLKEPRPLTYDVHSMSACTQATLHLEFDPIKSSDKILQKLQSMEFEIRSLVRVKTFYSISTFPRLPSQTLLGVCGGIRLRDDIVKISRQKQFNVSWNFSYTTNDSIQAAQSGDPHATQSDQLSRRSSVSTETSEPKRALRQKRKWTASINHPVDVDSRLLPTFCSSIVARLYSVVIRFKLLGLHNEMFDFEVPLQVVHKSPDDISDEGGRDFGNSAVGQDPESLNLRRASATTWFTDETQENEELPPHYQPRSP